MKQCTLLGTILDIKYQVVSVVFMGFIKTKASTEGSLCPGGWKRLERRTEGYDVPPRHWPPAGKTQSPVPQPLDLVHASAVPAHT